MKRAIGPLWCLLVGLHAGVSRAECDFPVTGRAGELARLDSVQELQVRVANLRRWLRNALDIEHSEGVRIRAVNRSSFKGTVAVRYPFGTCTFRATIRQNGDFKDHFFYENGETYSSLDVRLREGNIAGIVRFKLFRPESRYGFNEILATSLLRGLGFLAPRTVSLPVSQNGRAGRMLFQEKVAKEMLEFHGRREGPLLEGSEQDGLPDGDRLEIVDTRVALARMTNQRWAQRSIDTFSFAARSLGRLQLAYIDAGLNDREWLIDRRFLPLAGEADSRWVRFETLLLAMGGHHALYRYNRKVYHNPVSGSFEPVYYDGDVRTSQFRTEVSNRKDYRAFVRTIALPEVDALLHALDGFSAREWSRELGRLEVGRDREWQPRANEFLAAVRDNLRVIAQAVRGVEERPEAPLFSCDNDPACEEKELRRLFLARIGHYLHSVVTRVPGGSTASLVGLDRQAGSADVMNCFGRECTRSRLPWERAAGLFSTVHPVKGQPAQFYVGWEVPGAPREVSVTDIDALGLQVRHSRGARVVYSEDPAELRFIQSRSDDWFVVSGRELGTVRLSMESAESVRPVNGISPGTNEHGLTGCLTLYGLDFSGTRIHAAGGDCEDVLNIVDSRGVLGHVEVRKAPHDAVDLDFSTVEIAALQVEGAGNDCLDVSAGRYRVGQAVLSGCVDKAVSVGEGARLYGGQLRVDSAGTGIAVKDSAVAEVESLQAVQVTRCVSAYRKKQEFWGGRAMLTHVVCPEGDYPVDHYSSVTAGDG